MEKLTIVVNNEKRTIYLGDIDVDQFYNFIRFICFINLSLLVYLIFVKGDEVSLQMALNMVHKNSHEYVAVLFYASWCPFSRNFRPSFSVLSSLYSSIPHFAIEESAIRPRYAKDYPSFYIYNFEWIYLAVGLTFELILQHTFKVWSSWVSNSFST